MLIRPLLFTLLMTTCLAGSVNASMLAPTEENATSTAPASIPSLKAKLDAARGKRQTTPSPVAEQMPSALPPANEIIATSSVPVTQQVMRYDAPEKTSEIQNLLFDGMSSGTASAKPVVPTSLPKRDIPAVEIRKAFNDAPVVSDFKPKPSNPVGKWKSRGLEPTSRNRNDALCLLQNRFDNDLVLVIGQDASGEGMVAINYGMDILQAPQDYETRIQLDKDFDQQLSGYADQPKRIVTSLGKNPGFFSVLQSADALHMELPGLASTFSLKNLSQGLNSFSKCLTTIGAPQLPPALQAKAKAPTPDMPEVPIAPVATHDLNMPQGNNNPVISAPAITTHSWHDKAVSIVQQAGLATDARKANNQITWSSNNNQMQGYAQSVPSGDVLDTAFNMIDNQEKLCDGQFASQMGVPDAQGIIQMESKCVSNGNVTVSVWAIQQQRNAASIWQMSALRDARGLAFSARDRLVAILKTIHD